MSGLLNSDNGEVEKLLPLGPFLFFKHSLVVFLDKLLQKRST